VAYGLFGAYVPRTHRDHRLTCRYATEHAFTRVRCRLFLQVRTMGVQDGSRLRNGNSRRPARPGHAGHPPGVYMKEQSRRTTGGAAHPVSSVNPRSAAWPNVSAS
jgi:hypothetical protein